MFATDRVKDLFQNSKIDITALPLKRRETLLNLEG
jgi:hypothetical protein